MALGGKQGEYMDVKKFTPHSWVGFEQHVLFLVDWEFVWLGEGPAKGELCTLKAVVHKVVKDGMICEKYHMLDQKAVAKITGVPYVAEKHHPGCVVVEQALAGSAAGKMEEYLNRVTDGKFDYNCLNGLWENTSGSDKASFVKMAEKQGSIWETIRFVPHSMSGYGGHVGFVCDWEIKLNTPGQETLTMQAVVHKVVEDGKICAKCHMLDKYTSDRIAKMLAMN
ncbi:unnamed protein product [Amoebophrya sp. A120]|nr:unnamed protein product [Amoebophrya sp. A120]|eukprot:GSA120T00013094001.1